MKISVIIPVFNVEIYLKRCIESVISQSYKNLEIILVNDGSTDSSGDICKEFKRLDERIILINKENGGLSSARNAGLEIASGELLGFIDSDDWIEPDFYQRLYEGIIENNADISVMQFMYITDFKKINSSTYFEEKWNKFNRMDAIERYLSNNIIGYSACNKLYKKHLFKSIRYPHGMLMEDKATTYKLIHESTCVAVNMSKKYHYFLRHNSIMQTTFDKKKFDSLKVHEELMEFIDNYYPQFINLVRCSYSYEAFRLLLMMIRSNYSVKSDHQYCMTIINKNIKYFIQEKRFEFKKKIYLLVFYCFPFASYLLSKSKLAAKFIKIMRVM